MKIHLNQCIQVYVMSHRCHCWDQLELKNNMNNAFISMEKTVAAWIPYILLYVMQLYIPFFLSLHFLDHQKTMNLLFFQSFFWSQRQIKPRFPIFFYYLTSIVDGNVFYCILLRHFARHLSHSFTRIRENLLEWRHLLLCRLQSTVYHSEVELYYAKNCYIPNCIQYMLMPSFLCIP